MSLTDFKSGVTDSTRVCGAQFNVDYQTATASDYVEVKPSQKKKDKPLTLNAFNRRKSVNNDKKFDEMIIKQNIEIKHLKKENEKLKKKVLETEENRNKLRDKYESEMFIKLSKQTNEIKDIKENINLYESKLAEKNEQIHEKNILIQRNTEIERLRKELQIKTKHNNKNNTDIQIFNKLLIIIIIIIICINYHNNNYHII